MFWLLENYYFKLFYFYYFELRFFNNFDGDILDGT